MSPYDKMTAFVWALIAIGVLFILGSFFVSEKLSRSDLEKIREVSENEVRTILENELGKADEKIRDSIDEKTLLALDRAESTIEHQTNETLMGISEFSDTVLESMNKSHSEIMFMYDALSGKQEELTNLTKDVQLLESAVTLDKKELIDKAGRLEEVMAELEKEQNAVALRKKQLEEEYAKKINAAIKNDSPSENDVAGDKADKGGRAPAEDSDKPAKQAPVDGLDTVLDKIGGPAESRAFPSDDDPESFLPKQEGRFKRNDEILKLGDEGKSPVEIAKALGMGLGEVKLVLELESRKFI